MIIKQKHVLSTSRVWDSFRPHLSIHGQMHPRMSARFRNPSESQAVRATLALSGEMMQTSDFPSQSLLHDQHSNAHPPLPQKSIFNLLDLTSLRAPLPLPPLKLSLSVSPAALNKNRPGILLHSRGSPHYERASRLAICFPHLCKAATVPRMQRHVDLHLD